MNLDRSEYGEIYYRTFGKKIGRKACREGWERWQKVLASEFLVLHSHGAPVPELHANDYWAFVTLGPLRFLARINEMLLPQLSEMWLKFARDEQSAKLLAACGSSPRQRAREFILYSLVDGYVVDPVFVCGMVGAIAWLLSSAAVKYGGDADRTERVPSLWLRHFLRPRPAWPNADVQLSRRSQYRTGQV
jgi:hypothetical protein